MTPLEEKLDAATQKLCKWRSLFAGWWFGTRRLDDAQAQAARDNFDRTIMLRVEMSALVNLVVEKRLITREEFMEQMLVEIAEMEKMLEAEWPGIKSTPAGLSFFDLPKVRETFREKGMPA